MRRVDLYRPENWVVKNGLLVPKWTVQLLPEDPSLDLGRDVITYATFETLYPHESNTEEIIKREYGKYWLNKILEVIAKLNYLASFSQYSKTTEDELAFMSQFLSDQALNIFMQNKEVMKLVTRQQLLANMRLAFLYAGRKDSDKQVFENEKDFGMLIYRVTDYLEGYTKFLDEQNPTDKERQQLYMTFARNLFFNEHSNFAMSLSRYWYIFNRSSLLKKNRKFKIKSKFHKATNTDYNYLLAVGFAIWGFYSETNKVQRVSQQHEFLFSNNYFKDIKPKAKKKLQKALDLLSGDYEFFVKEFNSQKEHEGKHFFLNPFWKKPILKNEFDGYYLLDTNFLERRLGEGAFWYIFDKARDQKERMLLKSEWGYLFESYVNHLTKKTFSEKTKRVFSEIDNEQNSGVDLIIHYPDTLFFIEITTKQVRYNHWVESDYPEVESTLGRILLKDDPSKGRVIKLHEAIQKVKNGDVILEEVDVNRIKKFIPIILFENSPPMHRRLWHLYDKFLVQNGFTDRQFLDDLEFWDIEEYEMLMADVEKGNSLPEILKEKESSGYYKDAVRNFYIIKRGSSERHSLVREAFELLSEQSLQIFFKNKK